MACVHCREEIFDNGFNYQHRKSMSVFCREGTRMATPEPFCPAGKQDCPCPEALPTFSARDFAETWSLPADKTLNDAMYVFAEDYAQWLRVRTQVLYVALEKAWEIDPHSDRFIAALNNLREFVELNPTFRQSPSLSEHGAESAHSGKQNTADKSELLPTQLPKEYRGLFASARLGDIKVTGTEEAVKWAIATLGAAYNGKKT